MQAEKILGELTGGLVTDKAFLVDMITKYGRNEKNYEEVKKLGQKLYELLIDSGLNEKKEINKYRLLEKAENYLYGEKIKEAYEILKVLESQEKFILSKDETSVYYFSNHIEARKFAEQNPEIDFYWFPSIYIPIIILMAKAEIELGKIKEATKTISFLRKINPVSLDLLLLEARLEKEKNLEKFKTILESAFNYAFLKTHFASIYKEIAYYFEIKNDLKNSYLLLTLSHFYSNDIETVKALKRVKNKISASGEKPPSENESEIAKQIETLGYPLMLSEEMFLNVCGGYVDYLKSDNVTLEGKEFYRGVLGSITDNENFIFELEESAKEK